MTFHNYKSDSHYLAMSLDEARYECLRLRDIVFLQQSLLGCVHHTLVRGLRQDNRTLRFMVEGAIAMTVDATPPNPFPTADAVNETPAVAISGTVKQQ